MWSAHATAERLFAAPVPESPPIYKVGQLIAFRGTAINQDADDVYFGYVGFVVPDVAFCTSVMLIGDFGDFGQDIMVFQVSP